MTRNPKFIESPDGLRRWYLNGELHRDNDKPAVICADGKQEWYLNGKLHREDGPAVIWADGEKQWWVNDKLLEHKYGI